MPGRSPLGRIRAEGVEEWKKHGSRLVELQPPDEDCAPPAPSFRHHMDTGKLLESYRA